MIKKHQRFLNIIFVIVDALMLLAAYFLSYEVKIVTDPMFLSNTYYSKAIIWILPVLIISYFFMEVYSPMRSFMFRKEVILIIRAHAVGLIVVNGIFYFAKLTSFSREIFILFALFSLLFILIERFIIRKTLRHLRAQGYNQKHMLIIGGGRIGKGFAQKVMLHKDFGFKIKGFIDDRRIERGGEVIGHPILGGLDSLPEILAKNGIDEVVVALPLSAYPRYQLIIECCEKAGVRVRVVLDYNKIVTGYSKVEDFDGIPLLNIRQIPLDNPFNRWFKRVQDIIVSLIAIIITSPLLIFIAIGIKLTSPGPVLFRQERIGLNNRPFQMLKFRSMRVATDNSASTVWTTADDPRKTRFGSFLRKTSLDELPQFFNVLFGSMSVVGPRPERPFFVEQFKEDIPKYMIKHQVKPGITGWAQVNGWRGDTSIEKRIECDIDYIENWDLLFDIKVMFLTIFKGLVNKNAY